MGARPEDYRKVAPPHSFIHVDDFESPRHLAEYLRKLDENDDLYNEYFRWKGTGEFINTKYWCRLCGLIHEAQDSPRGPYRVTYNKLQQWWNGPGVCVDPGKHINVVTGDSYTPSPTDSNHTHTTTNGIRKWSSWRGVPRSKAIVEEGVILYP